MRAHLTRHALLAAITVTSLCVAPAWADPLHVEPVAAPIVGVDGLALEFDLARARPDADGLWIGGGLTLNFAGLRTRLFEADVRATFDGAGRIDTLYGRARVAPDPVAALHMAEFGDLIVGEIGLAYGRDLTHLPAPLLPDGRYLVVHLEAGPQLGLGALDIGARGGTTLIIDPTDPMIFVEGHIEGLNHLTLVESAAVGISAHGRIPLAAAHDWGLSGITTEMQGHVYIAGRATIPDTPLTIDGEILLDLDVNDDGWTLFDGSPEVGLLANGALELEFELGPLLGVEVPIASASAGGFIIGDQAGLWYSGVAGIDLRDVLPGLPFAMHGQQMVAGYASTTIEHAFVAFGTDIQLGDWSLVDSLLYVDQTGATLDAAIDLHLMTIDVHGRVGAEGLHLVGTASFDHALRAPREFTEWADVAVQYTANAAVCGYETVADGAVCGWDYVVDGAVCGYNVVTDGARCGWDTVFGWFCGWSGLCARREARTCDVDRGCHFEASCEVPGSCERIERRRETRLVPDFDFGRVMGELTVEVHDGAVRADARVGYCDPIGDCVEVDGALRVTPHDIELCVPVPDAGDICLSL